MPKDAIKRIPATDPNVSYRISGENSVRLLADRRLRRCRDRLRRCVPAWHASLSCFHSTR